MIDLDELDANYAFEDDNGAGWHDSIDDSWPAVSHELRRLRAEKAAMVSDLRVLLEKVDALLQAASR